VLVFVTPVAAPAQLPPDIRVQYLGDPASEVLSVFTTYGPPDAGLFTTFPPVRG